MSAIEEVWQSAVCKMRQPTERQRGQIIRVQIRKSAQITQYVKKNSLESHCNIGQLRQAAGTKRNKLKLTEGVKLPTLMQYNFIYLEQCVNAASELKILYFANFLQIPEQQSLMNCINW